MAARKMYNGKCDRESNRKCSDDRVPVPADLWIARLPAVRRVDELRRL